MTGATRAVMSRRVEARDSLDFFPTPPWATRAFLREALLPSAREAARLNLTVREPACGLGHMSRVLKEAFVGVASSDVHDYGWGHGVASYVGVGPDVLPDERPDWVITNPPFNLALQFAERALHESREGVALLMRTAWLEGAERHERLFRPLRPSLVAIHCDRVPMVKGRYDPNAATTTAYAWFVWRKAEMGSPGRETRLTWIAPGAKARWKRPGDVDPARGDGGGA